MYWHNAPTSARVCGRCWGLCLRPPADGCVPGGRALRRPAAVGGKVGCVRPQHRQEQPSRRLVRRPEPEDPSPAAAQEAHPVSEVRPVNKHKVNMLFTDCVLLLHTVSVKSYNKTSCSCKSALNNLQIIYISITPFII